MGTNNTKPKSDQMATANRTMGGKIATAPKQRTNTTIHKTIKIRI